MSKEKEFVREFAKMILSILGDEKDEWFKKNGLTGGEEDIKFSHDFPKWQLSSLGYYVAELAKNTTEVVDFSGGKTTSPSFNTIEYKRGKKVTFLIEGYAAIKSKETPIIFAISDYGRSIRFDLWCRKEDKEIGEEIFNQFKLCVSHVQFLKREKLLITQNNEIQFLNYPKVSRKSLILDPNLWDVFGKHLFYVLNNKDKILERGLEWRRGILIWGMPGTGKTLFGRILCNEITTSTVIWVTPRCIECENDVSKIFEMARVLSPSVVFFEDIDFFAPDRDEKGSSFILGELLTQLDGLSPNDGIFVIATTNKPGLLDQAIASRPARFDVKIKFEFPTLEEREKMYRLFLKNREDINYARLAQRSDDMTGAHIKETCVRGFLSILTDEKMSLEDAIIEGINSLREEELKSKPPLGQAV